MALLLPDLEDLAGDADLERLLWISWPWACKPGFAPSFSDSPPCAGDGDFEALGDLEVLRCGRCFATSRLDPSDCAGEGDLGLLLPPMPSWAGVTIPSDFAGGGDLEALLLPELPWARDMRAEPCCPDSPNCAGDADLEATPS